jgi:nucleotidyltransferase/DNA polymerase involved in DNA repair
MIIHLDADAFFASVEQAEDPTLRGKGDGRRGGKTRHHRECEL